MATRFKEITTNLLFNKSTIFILLIIVAFFVTYQNILLGIDHFWSGNHTFYNNYVIYKYSFFHLLHNQNLYLIYPEHGDFFMYSPTFALLMGMFAYLPDSTGLLLWNALNIFVLYYAIISIPNINYKNVVYIFLFILTELILSAQSSECNLLLAGLAIMTFNFLERGKTGYATLLIILGAFIKIFPLSICLLLLFYPKKIKAFAFLILWFIVLGALPLLLISPSHLYAQYLNWNTFLSGDLAGSIGMSIYQYTNYVFPIPATKHITLLVGLLALLSPLAFINKYSIKDFRISYVYLLLIWMVIFNYKAESPSFIIAIVGCVVWGFNSIVTKRKTIFMLLTLFVTCFMYSDIIPYSIRHQYFNYDFIKPLMPTLCFIVILIEMYKMKKDSSSLRESNTA